MKQYCIGIRKLRFVILLLLQVIFGLGCFRCTSSLKSDNFSAKKCGQSYGKFFITLPIEKIDIYFMLEDSVLEHYVKTAFNVNRNLSVAIKDYKKSKEYVNDFCSSAKFQNENKVSKFRPFKYSINFLKNGEGEIYSIKINYMSYIYLGKIITIKGCYPIKP